MNRLQFLLKASTQYGIHSPFVFRLYNEVLFAPMEKTLLRQLALDSTDLFHQLIFKLVNKLQPSAIYLLDSDDKAQPLVSEANPTTELRLWKKGDSQSIGHLSKLAVSPSSTSNELIASTETHERHTLPTDNPLSTHSQPTGNYPSSTPSQPEKNATSPWNDTTPFLVIPHPHKSDFDEFRWNTLCRLNEATATIDLFHSGIIFFSRKLSKQHFLLHK